MLDMPSDALGLPPEQGGGTADELAYRLRQQELTAEYGRFALRTHDTGALLQEATRICSLGLQSEFCKVMQFLPADNEFVVVAGVGWKTGTVGSARAGADLESPAGYAFQTGSPVISNHLAAETRFRTPRILVEHGVRRAINVLIQGDHGRFGVLEVDSPEAGRFTEADLAFMQGFANLLGVALERQQAEAALQASQTNLQQAYAHQEVLTREISHRVKNSLTLVAGMLNMQSRMSADPELKRALGDAQARVQTIAQVHDRLWRSHEVQTIDVAEFLGELCSELRSTASQGLTLVGTFEPMSIATDQAVPVGLLINELVTNAFKYAYPQGEGEVRVSLTHIDQKHLRLIVADDGLGLPEGYDPASTKSLGMKLVSSLARQLGGRGEWRNTVPGTMFTLDFFPVENPV